MKVAVATVQVPFISGGAELMTHGLVGALARAGHQVDVVAMPFRFGPPAAVLSSMTAWEEQDFDRFDCGPIDTVLALKFPAFYLRHHDKRVWLMHQHRSCYELFDTPYGDNSANPQAVEMRAQIVRRDTEALQAARKVFTISPTVSERLLRYNGIASEPLLQPPSNAEQFFGGDAMPYIFAPSRLESLKRQELLIRAMPMVREPVYAVIAGDGGMKARLAQVVAELGLQHRVRFLGRAGDAELRRHYAHALGVFFGPLLEDYGFITLEAMLSSRPVITCTDSGGPTHFVVDGQTGHVTEPEPGAVAAAINTLWANRRRARELGENARRHYDALNISWDHVLARMLTD
jgi:glycosyltransferase involved in cell wall biosynthesis